MAEKGEEEKQSKSKREMSCKQLIGSRILTGTVTDQLRPLANSHWSCNQAAAKENIPQNTLQIQSEKMQENPTPLPPPPPSCCYYCHKIGINLSETWPQLSSKMISMQFAPHKSRNVSQVHGQSGDQTRADPTGAGARPERSFGFALEIAAGQEMEAVGSR